MQLPLSTAIASVADQLNDLVRDHRASTWGNPRLLTAVQDQLNHFFAVARPSYFFSRPEPFVSQLADLCGTQMTNFALKLEFDLDEVTSQLGLAALLTKSTEILAKSLARAMDGDYAQKRHLHLAYTPLELTIERRAFLVELTAWTFATGFVHPKLVLPQAPPPAEKPPALPALPLVPRYKRRIAIDNFE